MLQVRSDLGRNATIKERNEKVVVKLAGNWYYIIIFIIQQTIFKLIILLTRGVHGIFIRLLLYLVLD